MLQLGNWSLVHSEDQKDCLEKGGLERKSELVREKLANLRRFHNARKFHMA